MRPPTGDWGRDVSRIRGMRASALLGAVVGTAVVVAGSWAAVAASASARASAEAAQRGTAVAEDQLLEASDGGYRLPFADGAAVEVAEEGRATGVYELSAGDGATVVAAAGGWLHTAVPPQPGEAAAPAASVWIEHPTGEYTRYTGLVPSGLMPAERAWIDAGTALGTVSGDEPLLWEVVVPAATADGSAGSIPSVAPHDGAHRAARVCGVPSAALAAGEYLAGACDNAPPAAALAAGPLVVDEGRPLPLDGSASADPEGEPLVYRWQLASFDVEPVAQPQPVIADDFEGTATLTVYDRIEGRWDAASVGVLVRNVPPSVEAVAVTAQEGGIGRVSATVSDPGDDTLAAQIDWGDGSPAQQVTIAELAAGVDHPYGDDGAFPVTVTATDDDGGVGAHAVPLQITGVAPSLTLAVDGSLVFPGGEYAVSTPGAAVGAEAEARDPGSDDLSFAWSNSRRAAFAVAPGIADPPLSPSGTFPVEATDATEYTFAVPGVERVRLSVTDDDGAKTDASAPVVVTGSATTARSTAWWVREYAALDVSDGGPVAGSLDIVQAVSGVFSEDVTVTTPAEAVSVLAARNGDVRARARAELLRSWLTFASGAVRAEGTVTLSSGYETPWLAVLADAEEVIAASAASDDELLDVIDELRRVTG